MTTRLYQILKEVSEESNNFKFSDKFKGAGYHSVQGGLHTAYYDLRNFIGTIVLQGTLVELPGNYDWVDIDGTNVTNADSSEITEIQPILFEGNFVWIRAKYQLTNGEIVDISYNY
jgi:hypothetical protein